MGLCWINKKLLFDLNLSLVCLYLSTDLVKLSVTPVITAECNQQVTLHCNVSSSQNDLSIKHMKWSQNKMSLCSVDDKGIISTHTHNLSDFHCEYRHGQLSLIFKRVQPLDSSKPYMCKLQSTGGASHHYTNVTLQGQCPHLFLFPQTVICSNTVCKTAVMNVKPGQLLFVVYKYSDSLLKGALWSYLVNKQKDLHSVLCTKVHCVYPWGLTNLLSAFTSS